MVTNTLDLEDELPPYMPRASKDNPLQLVLPYQSTSPALSECSDKAAKSVEVPTPTHQDSDGKSFKNKIVLNMNTLNDSNRMKSNI